MDYDELCQKIVRCIILPDDRFEYDVLGMHKALIEPFSGSRVTSA